MRVREASDIYSFRLRKVIESWVGSLPGRMSEAPILRDGEFARVFGYQLGQNIIQHAGTMWRGEYGSCGAIAMRVIPVDHSPWIKASFPNMVKDVFRADNQRGVLEICIGDRGVGIVASLMKTLVKLHKKYGLSTSDIQPRDVIAFAFDEIGTSKSPMERAGGVHALHRILRCTVKYQGALRLRTSGLEYTYNAASGSGFIRTKGKFGIYPSDEYVKSVIHPYGVQMQLLLPLTSPEKRLFTIPVRGHFQGDQKVDRQMVKVISVGTYFYVDVQTNEEKRELHNRLASLMTSLMEEPIQRVIVYDFSNYDWSEDQVADFLRSQKSVLHTHVCVGINLDAGLARALREREMLDLVDSSENMRKSHFFEVLSTKHRLFPVLDSRRKLWWFGLGRYELEGCLNRLFQARQYIHLAQLLSEKCIAEDPSLREGLKLYLNNNEQFFQVIDESGEKWRCILSAHVFEYAFESLVSARLPEIIKRLNCLEARGLYKLPSRPEFAQAFLRSSPLLQDNVSSQQIAGWIAWAIRTILNTKEEVLLVSATAPSELLSRLVGTELIEKKVHLLNLGHFSALDEENLVSAGDWDIPAIIVADVFSKGHTTERIMGFLRDRKIEIIGLVALMKFNDRGTPGEIKATMGWENLPVGDSGKMLQQFFLAEMRRPESLSESIAQQFPTSKLMFVEPFSLEVYPYSKLLPHHERLSSKDRINCDRLLLLEREHLLRAGHWVYGSHHFRVTISVKGLLENDDVAGEICSDIMRLCEDNDIDHILLPLHSHIGDFLPRIVSGTKLVLGKVIDYSFCMMTKVLTKRPFYILPDRVRTDLLNSFSRKVKTGGRGLRVLIMDDAIATGRTLETILRALILAGKEAITKHHLTASPIDAIYYYSIIDRQGRGKGTAWSSLRQMSLIDYEDDDISRKEFEFSFIFKRWLSVDMPVDERDTCELCEERRSLIAMKNMIGLPEDHSMINEIADKIRTLTARSAETPIFLNDTWRELPSSIEIGHFKSVKSAELV